MKEEQEGPGKGGQERSEALLSTWMKAGNDFWGSMMKTWPGFSPSSDAFPGVEKEDKAQTKRNEAADSVHPLPETVSQMSRVGFEAYSNLQRQWLGDMGRMGKLTETSNSGGADQNFLKACMQMYEKEFRPFFTMPPLGLTRFYQERMAQAMDQFNLYQAAMGNFYNLLYRPMEQSNRVLQEKLSSFAEGGNGPESFQEYYRLWLKTLEEHYMTLFRSSEFIQALAESMKATEKFIEARQAVLQDLLKFFSIPTHKDLEDLYQELYLLKKEVKELRTKLADRPLFTSRPSPNKKRESQKRKPLNCGENGHPTN